MNAPLTPSLPPYRHTPLFPLGKDGTAYRKITGEGVRVETVLGKEVVVVSHEAMRALAEAAFTDINHLLRPAHLQSLKSSSRTRRRPGTTASSPTTFEERQHRGRRRAADVPGHRHGDHQRQERPLHLDRR